jgi:ribonuclease D
MVEQSELDTDWSLVTEDRDLERAAEELASGSGPVGVDAERASGFRYAARRGHR